MLDEVPVGDPLTGVPARLAHLRTKVDVDLGPPARMTIYIALYGN
jgi:hypothetical protein